MDIFSDKPDPISVRIEDRITRYAENGNVSFWGSHGFTPTSVVVG